MSTRRVFMASPWQGEPGQVIPVRENVRAVMLDPAYCPPGYRAALDVGQGSPQILGPGDLAILPHKASSFRVWNHRSWLSGSPFTQLNLFLGNDATSPVGFICADNPSELWAMTQNRRDAIGPLATLGALYGPRALQELVGPSSGPDNYFVADGLTGLRITALPMVHVGGMGLTRLVTPAPADFAATILLWAWVGFANSDPSDNFRTVRQIVPRGDNQGQIGNFQDPVWAPNGEANLDADNTHFTWDRQMVGSPFAFGFSCTALAGTGVDRVGLIVEGY